MNTFTLLIAAIELVAPAQDATIRLVPDCQRAVITNETRVAREAALRALGKKAKDWRKNLPVVLEWQATGDEKGPWEIKIGTKPDLSDARSWLIRAGEIDTATGRDKESESVRTMRYEVPYFNPEIATTYYWNVSGNITCGRFGHRRVCDCKDRQPIVESGIGSFGTADLAPRWIAIEGRVGNFRDLGGRIGLGGKRVRQGMVYRSQGLNNNSIDGMKKGKNRLTVSDVEYLTKTLGIKTDLDLRSGGETADMKTSPMGSEINFIHHSSSFYAGIFSDSGKKVMAENFRVFCDEKNYPILFHCIGGADRTGALGYVLNGVLGVAQREIETDWESTFYPNIPYKDKGGKFVWNSEGHFDEGFGKYGTADDSWNRRIELYLLDCGITQKEIEEFRSIMLQ